MLRAISEGDVALLSVALLPAAGMGAGWHDTLCA